jgi:hypothetical protein
VDEKTLAGIVQIIGLAELVIGQNIIPGLKDFFERKFQMTDAEKIELAVGLDEYLAIKARITARRAEIAKESK